MSDSDDAAAAATEPPVREEIKSLRWAYERLRDRLDAVEDKIDRLLEQA